MVRGEDAYKGDLQIRGDDLCFEKNRNYCPYCRSRKSRRRAEEEEEQTLLTWSDADIPSIQRHNPQILHYPGLEIYLDQRCVLKNGQSGTKTARAACLLSVTRLVVSDRR